jgi:predicted component of type VI protein secretion system
MRAFATLTERGDVSRAAILADEITRAIENFDPRLYFPELFSEFSRLLSDHVDELEVAWQARETLAWKVRAQFSQVDLKRFVAGS